MTDPTGSKSDRRPLLTLLHGVFFDHHMWDPLIAALDGAYEVVAVDLPGHGDRRHDRFTMAGARRAVRDALGAAGSAPAALVGLSLGGFVAMDLVRADPTFTPLLVLTGATREPSGFVRAPLKQLYQVLAAIPDAITNAVGRTLVRLATPESVADALLRGGPYASGGFHALAQLPQHGFSAIVRGYPGRVVFINGRRDPIARPGERAFIAGAPRAALHVIGGVGHLAPVEAPEAFARILHRAIDERMEHGATASRVESRER